MCTLLACSWKEIKCMVITHNLNIYIYIYIYEKKHKLLLSSGQKASNLMEVIPLCENIEVYIYIWSDFDRASSLICGNEMPTRCNRWFLLQILLLAQHVSGTIMPIIRSSRVLYRWLLPVVFTDNLKTKAPNTTGSNHLYNTLELLMMGIMVPRNMLRKQ